MSCARYEHRDVVRVLASNSIQRIVDGAPKLTKYVTWKRRVGEE